MPPTLSVIIPTLNEAATLPNLLRALQAQTCPPTEVIVADAGSKDGTAEGARALGAIVVPGGKPGPGRNAGARVATSELLLFLDADVEPPPDFIEKAVAEFLATGCVVATTLQQPLGNSLSDKLLLEAVNVGMQVLRPFSPQAPGYCILIQRKIHQAINGFDEAVVLAEDFEYVNRAAKHGRFGVLTSVRIPVSMRRLEEDGFAQVAYKYVWCEMYALAGKPIYSVPFEYKFGEHLAPGANPKARPLIDIESLREQLGRFENPLQSLSEAGRERLEQLARRDWFKTQPEKFQLTLERRDAAILLRYLRQRLKLLRTQAARPSQWLARPTPLQDNNLWLLDLPWRRAPRPDKKETDSPPTHE